jgi:integrase/recombinase XerD
MKSSIELSSVSFIQLMRGFKVHLSSGNFAKINGYQTIALDFLFYMESMHITEIKDIGTQDVYKFIEQLKTRTHKRKNTVLSQSYIKYHLYTIRLLFDYMFYAGITNYTICLPKRTIGQRTKQNILTLQEVNELFKVANDDPLSLALLVLLYACGMRRGEVFRLNASEVSTHSGLIIVREGKGRRSRTIPLSKTSIQYLRRYQTEIRDKLLGRALVRKPASAFLINVNGNRFGYESIYRRLGELAHRTNNLNLIQKNVTPHLMRHSIATHLIEQGAETKWIQQFLGHNSSDSTEIYTSSRKQNFSNFYG